MTVYISDPKNSSEEFLQLMNTFSEVAGYMINFKKISSPSIYIGERSIVGNQRNLTFHKTTNSIKYLGVTLTKEMHYLFDKNLKALKKDIEEDTRKMEGSPMLLDWEQQHSKNGNSTKSNL